MSVLIREHRFPLGEDESPLFGYLVEYKAENELSLPPRGVPLEVHAVSLPFVLCMLKGAENPTPLTLDLRHCSFVRAESSYVAAYAALAKAASARQAADRNEKN